jgi:ubiquinone/menaquinone biosynthesis C-methylase UbiE
LKSDASPTTGKDETIAMEEHSTTNTTSIQKISLDPLHSEGMILDIGGGGEGLVSRITEAKVCALDIRISEIREAQIHGSPANWFVGDGQSLCFQDGVFDTVALWFSLGYMKDWSTKENVLKEAYRVLNQKGKISILASNITGSYERLIFWGHFTFPDGTVSQIGYGVRGGQDQTLERLTSLLQKIGFKIQSQENNDAWFRIQATKR